MRPQLKKHHSDVAIMIETQQWLLPGWAAIGRCCLYNVNVGADAVTLLVIWNTAMIFEM